jgi:hypothetical protein
MERLELVRNKGAMGTFATVGVEIPAWFIHLKLLCCSVGPFYTPAQGSTGLTEADMKKTVVVAIAALMLGLAAPSANAQAQPKKTPASKGAQADVPAEITNSKKLLEDAKADLAKAGDEWGGHRSNAIAHINKAIEELDKASEVAKQKK